MTRILVFGNPLVEKDCLPLRLLPELRKRLPDIEFIEADPEDMPNERNMLIIDSALAIKDVMLIDNLDKLENCKLISAHDMDLGQTLSLMKVAGLLDSVKIIAVPIDIAEAVALDKIEKIIRAI